MGRRLLAVAWVVIIGAVIFWGQDRAMADSSEVVVRVNGAMVAPDIPPRIVNGSVLVPLRLVAEVYGHRVDWDDANRRALIDTTPGLLKGEEGNKQEISIYLGTRRVETNVPPLIIDGRVLVPLRAVSEALGLKVSWDDLTRTVSVDESIQHRLRLYSLFSVGFIRPAYWDIYDHHSPSREEAIIRLSRALLKAREVEGQLPGGVTTRLYLLRVGGKPVDWSGQQVDTMITLEHAGRYARLQVEGHPEFDTYLLFPGDELTEAVRAVENLLPPPIPTIEPQVELGEGRLVEGESGYTLTEVQLNLGKRFRFSAVNPARSEEMFVFMEDVTAKPPSSRFITQKTEDGGETWQEVDLAGGKFIPRRMGISPVDPRIIYATDSIHDVYRSTDGGKTWALVRPNPSPDDFGPYTPVILRYLFDPRDPNRVYAYEAGRFPPEREGLLFTSDGGETWSDTATGSGMIFRGGEQFGPPVIDAEGTLYLGTGLIITGEEPSLWGLYGHTLYKSEDQGVTWTNINVVPYVTGFPAVIDLLGTGRNPGTLVIHYAKDRVGSREPGSHYILSTDDGGQNWQGFSLPFEDDYSNRYAINPNRPEQVFAVVPAVSAQRERTNYLAVTEDGGSTWRRVQDLGHGISPTLDLIPETNTLLITLSYQPYLFRINESSAKGF